MLLFSTVYVCLLGKLSVNTSSRWYHMTWVGNLTPVPFIVVGNIYIYIYKKKKTGSSLPLCRQLSALVAWPAMHWRAMANLCLSHGADSELHNLSTQLARFPLAGLPLQPCASNRPWPLWYTFSKPRLCRHTFLS